MTIHVGDTAPDFTLPDQHGRETSLSRVDGPVLLVFFPAAFTAVCSSELAALRDAHVDDRVRILAVSCDSRFALRALDEQEQIPFALLSDFWPHGEVARAYGAFLADKGIATRATYLIDATGIVRARWLSSPVESRDVGEYLAAISAMGF